MDINFLFLFNDFFALAGTDVAGEMELFVDTLKPCNTCYKAGVAAVEMLAVSDCIRLGVFLGLTDCILQYKCYRVPKQVQLYAGLA